MEINSWYKVRGGVNRGIVGLQVERGDRARERERDDQGI